VSLRLINCTGCGIANSAARLRCVSCVRRLDRPMSFKKKDDVFDYFSRGGFTDIAEELMRGQVPWDPKDEQYTLVLEHAILLSLEESFSTLDILFYAKDVASDSPYLGIWWPDSPLLQAIQVSFVSEGGEERFTVIERQKTKDRGASYRFDTELGKSGNKYRIKLITVFDKSSGPNKKYESQSIGLRPTNPADAHSAFELFRINTGAKVK